MMNTNIEIEQEENGRWIADISELPDVMAYGSTKKRAIHNALKLMLDVMIEEHTNHLTITIKND